MSCTKYISISKYIKTPSFIFKSYFQHISMKLYHIHKTLKEKKGTPQLTLVNSLLWVHAGAPSIPRERGDYGDSSELRKHKHHFDKAAVQLQGCRSSSSMTCEPALKLQAINSHPIKTLIFSVPPSTILQ